MIDVQHLPNCLADEHLVYFLRKHPITLSSVGFGYLFLILLPFIGFGLLQMNAPSVLHDPILFPLILLGASFFWLYCWLFLFQAFLDYYLDIWVVTNHRIVNITQTGLFHRETSELRLYRVQDASASVGGFLHTMLNFGKIEIQTAGEKEHFVFEDIPHPQDVAKNVMQLAEKDRADSIDTTIEELEIQGEKLKSTKKPPSQ